MKYFKLHEFDCRCGCGANNMTGEILTKLDYARDIAGIPFLVSSGTRCAKRNKQEGGLASSSHLRGLAADITATDSRTRSIILSALIQAGFSRIGIAKSFIHVDTDPTKPEDVTWLYR